MEDTSAQSHPTMPEARGDIVFRQVGDEWLLFDPITGEIHVLNLSAALLWSHCDGTTPVATVLATLGEAFGDAPSREELLGEAHATLQRFQDCQLLVPPVRELGMGAGGIPPDASFGRP